MNETNVLMKGAPGSPRPTPAAPPRARAEGVPAPNRDGGPPAGRTTPLPWPWASGLPNWGARVSLLARPATTGAGGAGGGRDRREAGARGREPGLGDAACDVRPDTRPEASATRSPPTSPEVSLLRGPPCVCRGLCTLNSARSCKSPLFRTSAKPHSSFAENSDSSPWCIEDVRIDRLQLREDAREVSV